MISLKTVPKDQNPGDRNLRVIMTGVEGTQFVDDLCEPYEIPALADIARENEETALAGIARMLQIPHHVASNLHQRFESCWDRAQELEQEN